MPHPPRRPPPGRRAPRPPAAPARPVAAAPAPAPAAAVCEVETIPGLEDLAQAELAAVGGVAEVQIGARPGVLRVRYSGDLHGLRDLRAAVAVFLVVAFPVPRPRGLLGNQQFATLLERIAAVQALHPPGAFRTLRLSAAGEDSAVLTRLRADLAARTGLLPVPDEGDLLLRLRRAADQAGWEVLVRLTPRPLTVRPWRVCNLPGALNAVVAGAMIQLSDPHRADRYLNLVCGSGTLLIERLARGPAKRLVGCDISPAALACARANLVAARAGARAQLLQADAGQLPLPTAGFDVLTADLPFGNRVGSHDENERLYPRLLAEAARVAAPGARLVLITHEVHLLDGLLAGPAGADWHPVATRRITLPFGAGGLNPRIYLLRRQGRRGAGRGQRTAIGDPDAGL